MDGRTDVDVQTLVWYKRDGTRAQAEEIDGLNLALTVMDSMYEVRQARYDNLRHRVLQGQRVMRWEEKNDLLTLSSAIKSMYTMLDDYYLA